MSQTRREFLSAVGATLASVVTGAAIARCAAPAPAPLPACPVEPVPMPEPFEDPPWDLSAEAFARLYDDNVRELLASMERHGSNIGVVTVPPVRVAGRTFRVSPLEVRIKS